MPSGDGTRGAGAYKVGGIQSTETIRYAPVAGTVRYLNSSDCAYLLGVVPSAVTNWLKRGSGPLPEPAAHVGNAPLWTIEQIALLAAEARDKQAAKLRNMETAAALILGEVAP